MAEEKRTEPVQVYFTRDEKERVRQQATSEGERLASFIRRTVLRNSRDIRAARELQK